MQSKNLDTKEQIMQGMDGFFIDKLNISQTHHDVQGFPAIGRFRRFQLDTETGENIEFSKQTPLQGSYSSLVTVHVDVNKISMYGNPSRWQRIDNLFGLKTIDECVAVYNNILHGFGLPPFTKATGYYYPSSRSGKVAKISNAATIKHLDFTRNLFVGFDNEKPFHRALSAHSLPGGISPYLFPDQNTVEWYGKNVQKNGSHYRYSKVYCKTSDLLRHQNERLKNSSFEDIKYYDDLLQYTVRNGVVREEHSFKRDYLIHNNLFAYGLFNESDFYADLQHITNLRHRLEVHEMTHNKYETVAERLLAKEIVKSQLAANTTQSYYFLWLYGHYIDRSKRQYREHKCRLLQIGIDISQPLDIAHKDPIFLKEAKIIEVGILQPPAWYRTPVVPNIDDPLPVITQKPFLRLVA